MDRIPFSCREKIKLAVLACDVDSLSEALDELSIDYSKKLAFVSKRGNSPVVISFNSIEVQPLNFVEIAVGRSSEPSWLIWSGGHAAVYSPQDMLEKVMEFVREDLEKRNFFPEHDTSSVEEFTELFTKYFEASEDHDTAFDQLKSELNAALEIVKLAKQGKAHD